MRKLTGMLFVAVLGTALLLHRGLGQQGPAPDLRYDQSGAMLFPQNYRDWTWVTSGLGMTYRPTGGTDPNGNPLFDNVLVNPAAYRSFLQTGTWPDKTVMILEIRRSDSKASINKGGRFQTAAVAIEVHAKDAAKGGWGFYAFEPGSKSATILPKTADCYSCHEQNAAVDTTFVQFYPTLIDLAKSKGTYKAAAQ